MASAYWFARRFPVGHPRNAMGPVSREGWMVVLAFIAAMSLAPIGFVIFSVSGSPILGGIFFIVVAAMAGWGFIKAANGRVDHNRTVGDYRRLSGGTPT